MCYSKLQSISVPNFMLTTFRIYNISRNLYDQQEVLPRWPSGPKRDCHARGLGFHSQVEPKVLLGFSMKFSVAARSQDLCPVNGNKLAPYYMGPKHTGEVWVYISTPLPNPQWNRGVIVCVCMCSRKQDRIEGLVGY